MNSPATTTGASGDPDVVVAGLVAWLQAEHGTDRVEFVGVERPSAGLSTQTLLVDVRTTRGGRVDLERLVVKLPPAGAGVFPDYDFALQATVQNAVATAGIPAPVPAQAVDDPRWMGSPFLVMPAIAGHIIDELPARDPWLMSADPERNTALHRRYLDVIADVHRVAWKSAAGVANAVPRRDNAAELAYWRSYLGWFGDGEVLAPGLVEALEWCDDHQPPSEPEPSLLWGDVRLGNLVFDEDRRLAAVLDWEMATIGAAEHDLAWTLTLEATQAQLFQRTVPGFLDRTTAIEHYETRLGRPLQDMHWYETLAMVRATAIMTRVAHLRSVEGHAPLLPIADNPILDLLARRLTATGERP